MGGEILTQRRRAAECAETGWKKVRLDQIGRVVTGKTPKTSVSGFWNGDVPFVTPGDIQSSKHILKTTRYVTKDGLASVKGAALPRGAICVSCIGVLGYTAITERECITNQQINSLIVDSKFDVDFVYYALRNNWNAFKNMEGFSSVVSILNKSTFSEIELPLPPLPTQRKIAAVLGALDDKIENNRKICANLEAQAQAIFKSWFVDFEPFGGKMPQEWKLGKLGDVLQRIGTGLNPRKNFVLGKGKNFYVTIKNMGNNRIYLDEKCDKVDDDAIKRINERSDLKAGDVLFSGIGTIGRTYLIPETPTNWNTSESVFNMRVTEGFPPEFLYLFLLSDPTQEYVQLNALGSAQKGIRMADLKVCPCVIPAQEWLHKFSELVRPIIKTIQEKWREMDLLAAMRDALLPKLMSGEIDVEKVKVA